MSGTPPVVLIAEDEAPLRHLLKQALEQEGYRVLGAGSAETTYELLASEPADAIMLDMRLPTMSGLALYLAIVHRWPALVGRIAIITSDEEADEVQGWVARNPCAVLRKPFDLDEIIRWVGQVTQPPDRERANG